MIDNQSKTNMNDVVNGTEHTSSSKSNEECPSCDGKTLTSESRVMKIDKNEIKKMIIIIVAIGMPLFGGYMGIFAALMLKDVVAGIIIGLLSGVAFCSLFSLFVVTIMNIGVNSVEKKFLPIRNLVSTHREIRGEGFASIVHDNKLKVGWMILNDDGLRLYSNPDSQLDNMFIPINDILEVKVGYNQMTVITGCFKYRFGLYQSNRWRELIYTYRNGFGTDNI